MRRRLSLAAALVHDPAFLFLDEPTAGLDPILRANIWDLSGRARRGQAMLVTTQYVDEAEYCDQVLLIHEGRVIAAGTPAELRRAATGGEILDVHFERPRPHIIERLQSLPFVHRVELLDRADDVRVVVDDVVQEFAPLSPHIASLEEEGFVSMEPHALLFDDVFVRLVERANKGEQEETDGDAHDSPPTSVAA